jgi:gliding motility-associated-like protein
VIVEAPAPNFRSRDLAGIFKNDFCINEQFNMRNLTPNINTYTYRWRFYDDEFGNTLLDERTSFQPNFSYPTGGRKLVRLIATNLTAQSPCIEEYTDVLNITPSLVANIEMTDLLNNPISSNFCQESSSPLTNFNVRFHDASVGTVTANTRWRWEFFDQNHVMVRDFPNGGGYSSTPLGPFNEVFSTRGIYLVRLYIRDNVTSCETIDEDTVFVLEKPVPIFSSTTVCIGEQTHFTDASTLNAVIPGEQITSHEWDMDYDGVTFTKDPLLDDEVDFDFTFLTSGTHRVALRVTSDGGGCDQILAQDVIVNPLPNADITSDITEGCSELSVNFTNNSIAGQPQLIDEYHWEVDDGSGAGFQLDSIQRPSDPGFNDTYTMLFVNTTSANRIFRVRLRVITVNDCEQVSNIIDITVNPGPTSGFVSLNYSPFNNNCSPVSVDFIVDSETQALNPIEYEWVIADANGVIDQISTATTPAFTYNFTNATQVVKDYFVTLNAELASGCSEDSTRTIRVSPLPSSEFDINTLINNCQMTSLQMEATQEGLVAYAWTLLLNNQVVFTSTTVGDSFTYDVTKNAMNQNVEVRLITTNITNCQSTLTSHNIVIPSSSNIIADFLATPTVQQLPNATVTITNNSTPGVFQYLWDFGDGTNSTDASATSHTYTDAGTYSITLTISDNTCSDSHTVAIEITPIPPIVDFAYNPPSGCAPLIVDFTNLSQFTDPSTYLWDFGDGQISAAISPTHAYFEPGLYTVTLSAANASGDTDTETKTSIIEVFSSPTAQFSVYPQVLDIPGDILYTRNRSVGATSFLWSFGDNTTSTDFEPQHKYEAEGLFEVELIAYGPDGCNDTTRLSSPIKTELSGKVLIPNAFSPNLSGPGSTNKLNNEVFIPLMNRVTKFQMYIFNRWGTLLFESSNQEVGWDGYFQGKLCQQDVYIYKIILEYDDGKTITRTGDINLIR